MNEHIGVAVAEESQRVFDFDAAKPERTAFNQLMDVVAHPHAYLHTHSLFPKQVFQTVHIEGEGEAQCLVEWVALGCGNHVASVK